MALLEGGKMMLPLQTYKEKANEMFEKIKGSKVYAQVLNKHAEIYAKLISKKAEVIDLLQAKTKSLQLPDMATLLKLKEQGIATVQKYFSRS
jgi:hypothetical protein